MPEEVQKTPISEKTPDKISEKTKTAEEEWDKYLTDPSGLTGKPTETRMQEREIKADDRLERIKKNLRCFFVWLCNVSKKLEALSWIGFAVCFFVAGCKFANQCWLEMILLAFLGGLFANNGIRLPTSTSAKVVKQAFAKFSNING